MSDLLNAKFIKDDTLTKEKTAFVDPVLDKDPVTLGFLKRWEFESDPINTYKDDTSAIAAGELVGNLYKTLDGDVRSVITPSSFKYKIDKGKYSYFYTTLASAITDYSVGDEIHLLQDIVNETIFIPSGKDVTINGNGVRIYRLNSGATYKDPLVQINGRLTLYNVNEIANYDAVTINTDGGVQGILNILAPTTSGVSKVISRISCNHIFSNGSRVLSHNGGNLVLDCPNIKTFGNSFQFFDAGDFTLNSDKVETVGEFCYASGASATGNVIFNCNRITVLDIGYGLYWMVGATSLNIQFNTFYIKVGQHVFGRASGTAGSTLAIVTFRGTTVVLGTVLPVDTNRNTFFHLGSGGNVNVRILGDIFFKVITSGSPTLAIDDTRVITNSGVFYTNIPKGSVTLFGAYVSNPLNQIGNE